MERFNNDVRLILNPSNFEKYIDGMKREISRSGKWRKIRCDKIREKGYVEYVVQNQDIEHYKNDERQNVVDRRNNINVEVHILFNKMNICSCYISYDPIYGHELQNFYHITNDAPTGYLGIIGVVDSMYIIDAIIKREFLYDTH